MPSPKYKITCQKENDAFHNLLSTLNEEQAKLLDKLMETIENNNEIEVIERYKQGFKTGLLIGIECNNIKL